MNRKTKLYIFLFLSAFPVYSFSQSTLNVKAFVEGYYIDTPGVMTAVIDPVSQPALFDTITVELHSVSDTITEFSEKVVFNINGEGTVTLPPVIFGNYYYLVLKHRNSIQTWSKLPVLITAVTDYDFTTSITTAFGDNLKWVTNAACMFSGDLNQDNLIDSADLGLIGSVLPLFLYDYYLLYDLNGDSAVDVIDMNSLDNNFIFSVSASIPVITSVNELVYQSNAMIYPNPATRYFNIPKVHPEINSVNVYDSAGRLVLHKQLNDEYKIDISAVRKGVYYVSLNNSQVNLQKLIIN